MASTQIISNGVKSAAPPGPWREFWTAFSANRGAIHGANSATSSSTTMVASPMTAPRLAEKAVQNSRQGPGGAVLLPARSETVICVVVAMGKLSA